MLHATLLECSQRIILAQQVVDHTGRFRQLTWRAKEAGGQLFGVIEEEQVVVSKASGPYPGDQRSRSSYRSDAQAAQYSIDEHAGLGLLYLGEWHTHPQAVPAASTADLDAMRRLRHASQTRTSALLMLIQGNVAGAPGLSLYSFYGDRTAQWTIAQAEG